MFFACCRPIVAGTLLVVVGSLSSKMCSVLVLQYSCFAISKFNEKLNGHWNISLYDEAIQSNYDAIGIKSASNQMLLKVMNTDGFHNLMS